MIEKKQPLVILTGPTAAGKTALSLQLAEAIGGEIISADSMQVYRHMDIGSAKIRQEEMKGIPHHLIDILEPTEDFNVVIFQKEAGRCIQEIYERGHIPILTGGTGFYIQAILYNIDFTENEEDTACRKDQRHRALKFHPSAGYSFRSGGKNWKNWRKKRVMFFSIKCWPKWMKNRHWSFMKIIENG